MRMHHIKKAFLSLSVFQKMFFGIIIVIILMLTATSIMTFSYSLKIYENEASKNTHYIVDVINMYIDDNMKQFDNITSFFYIDSERKKVISREYGKSLEDNYHALKTMDEFYNQILFLKNEINGFYIYLLDGRSYSYFKFGANKIEYSPTQEAWFKKTLEANGGLVIFPPHLPFHLERGDQAISYSRLLRSQDNSSQEPLGVMIIDIPVFSLQRILDKVNIGSSTQLLILDKNSEVVYSNKNYVIQQNDEGWMKRVNSSEQGKFIYKIAEKNHLITFGVSKITGWKILLLSPYDEIAKDGTNLLVFYFFAGVGALIIAGIFAFLLSSIIYKSLKNLKSGFDQIKNGNFDFQLKTRQRDEIGQLVLEFNTMVTKIKTLIKENYEEKAARSEAELKYLQAQINPHFIYNSLQVISSMAVVKNEPEISTMAKSLAGVIKYSVNVEKRIVSFKEELDNVRHYIEVQKIRFDDYISFEVIIDNNFLGYGVIKLILQPLVENSIVHGIEPKGAKGFIRLAVVSENTKSIRIEVFDNGKGFSMERLSEIRRLLEHDDAVQLNNEDGTHTNIGLRNINKRLKILYGESAGIKIDSEYGCWTRIGFIVPAIPFEEEKNK